MNIEILKKYFPLNCNKEIKLKVVNFEEKYNIRLSEEYKYLIDNICKTSFDPIIFKVAINTWVKDIFYFKLSSFMDLDYIEEIKNIMTNNEIEWHEWNDYISFQIDGLFPICEIDLDSDLRWLFLSANSGDRGSLYIVDVNLIYDIKEGYPIKIKIANSISHLLEIVESQKGEIPQEYIIL